jgi:hypothetical protein
VSIDRVSALVATTVAAVVGLRLAVVLTGSHLISHSEELYRGTIAREVLEGLHAPLWSYQADHYSGGSLVVGLLAAPAIALFGPRLFALKLVAIAFAAATAAVAVQFLARRYGVRAALAGAVLFVMPPPGLVQLQSLAKGFHTESPLFTLASLSALFAFVYDGRRRRWLFAAAFAGGLGVSFTPIAALGLVGVVVTWLVVERGRPRGADALIFALGVGVGMAPALVYVAAHGLAPGPPSLAEVFSGTAEPFAVRLAKIPARVAKLIVLALPLSAGFPDLGRIPGLMLSSLYAALAYGAAAILLAREPGQVRGRGPAARLLALPAAVFVVIYACTPIAIPTGTSAWAARHLAPLQVLGLLLVAVAAARIRQGMVILAVLTLLGGLGHAKLLASEPPGLAWLERADSYYHLGMVWTMREGRTVASLDSVQPRLERLGVERRAAAYRGAIEALAPSPDATTPQALQRLLVRLPPTAYPVVWESLGRWLAQASELGADEVASRLEALPPRGRRLGCDALELARAHHVALEGRSALEWWTRTPARAPCVADDERLGLGYLLATYRHADGGCPQLRALVARLDTNQRRAVYRGAGRGAAVVESARTGLPAGGWITGIAAGDVACLRQHRSGTLLQAPDGVTTLADTVPIEHLDDFFWGVGWEIADAFGEDPLRIAHTIDRLPKSSRTAAREGSAAAMQRLQPTP